MPKSMQLLLGSAFAVLLAVPAAAAPVTLVATLSGANQTGGGDADGTGTFSAEIDADAGDFCYTLTADKVDKVTMAHVHTGAAGANGPPVVTLELGSDLCVAAEPDVLKAILAAPEGYYVNVHNAAYPAGAIRGQLAKK